MLPTYTALYEAHGRLCERLGVKLGERELHDAQIAIARARILAMSMAAGGEDDEPAALFTALLLDPIPLGRTRDALPLAVLRLAMHPRGLTVELDFADHLALRAIRACGMQHGARRAFDEVRAFVAARTRPRP